MRSKNQSITRVTRTKSEAKESYDRMSPYYDLFSGAFEQKYKTIALQRLNVTRGETVLEIGFGTGHSLTQLAEAIGEAGKVYGIDISSGMLAVSKQRLEKAGLWSRVELTCDDAMNMPYADNMFDAVFMSFTLELFDVPEIPIVLAETRRVLKTGGRLGVLSMSKKGENSLLLRLYEWLHLKLPKTIDCRPIYAEQSIKDAGFEISHKERVSLMGLPAEIVVGKK